MIITKNIKVSICTREPESQHEKCSDVACQYFIDADKAFWDYSRCILFNVDILQFKRCPECIGEFSK